MRFVRELNAPLPEAFRNAAAFVIRRDLRGAFAAEPLDLDRIRTLLQDAELWGVDLNGASLWYTLERHEEQLVAQWEAAPDDLAIREALHALVRASKDLPFPIAFPQAQNRYYVLLKTHYREQYRKARRGDEQAQDWVTRFIALGEDLNMQVEETTLEEIRALPSVAMVAQQVSEQSRIPRATYRLQFNPHFRFTDATALVTYLEELGVSDAYGSPLFRACPGSEHGYDVCDFSQINPEVGTEEEFDAFTGALRQRRMGLLFDMVPNHMGIACAENGWWMDVLENGPSSLYAPYFDIDWHPMKRELANKVLLPILGDQYGNVLERGEFRLAYEQGAFCVWYWETKLPIAPHTYDRILSVRRDALAEQLGADHEHVLELDSILTALSYLPPYDDTDPERMAERHREKEIIKRRIATLYDAHEAVRAMVHAALDHFNDAANSAESADLLDDLLDAQPYRPAYWRVAADEINYRRFFDVNTLAAIRVERPEVFKATHALAFRLLAEGKISGLRIDHPDGLWNPPEYFRHLQEGYIAAHVRARLPDADDDDDDELAAAVAAWYTENGAEDGTAPQSLYVVAEKILSEGEPMPADWPIAGTTGYDFMNGVNGLFVDARHRDTINETYLRFTSAQPKSRGAASDGQQTGFRSLVNEKKKMIMLVSLPSEINALSFDLERISERNRAYRDFTLTNLTFALREVIAGLSVYRTYIYDITRGVAERDAQYIEAAVAEAKRRNPRTAVAVFDFIRDTLLLRNVDTFREEDRPRLLDWVMKFQQITGPVTAKGVEDTAFYVYNRLVSLNEVGGHPTHFGVSVPEFHAQTAERSALWPHTLLSTSTHDTKRSEDVRTRIDVLSELPDEWRAALHRWSRANAKHTKMVDGDRYPSLNDEYLLYQTLLGAWPLEEMTPERMADFRARIAAYMLKAAKEAKVITSWVNPNEAYDQALGTFVDRVLAEGANSFLADFLSFQRRVAFFGMLNGLSQMLLKLTVPGVPDVYQGTELWDLSLVDPDNRRPVDYERRRALLAEIRERAGCAECGPPAFTRELLETYPDGRVKLFITQRALACRRDHEALFTNGDYAPLIALGEKADHVVAFARTLGAERLIAVAPRLMAGLTEGEERPPLGTDTWGETWLPLPDEDADRRYRNLFTGEELTVTARDGAPGLPLGAVCAHFSVALLERL
jgi:(1->4)-alpha-D-glucan 1-alpha-D-glucosylmutase